MIGSLQTAIIINVILIYELGPLAGDGDVVVGLGRRGDFYDYKELAAKDKVEATRTTLARIQESGTEGQRQILPAWEANLRRDEGISANLAEERRRRLKEAEQHRYPQVSWALKSLGRIEVVGPS